VVDVQVFQGDCRTVLDTLPDNSVDAVICDPPYELNLMNRLWDRSGVAFDKMTWEKCRRVLKPGAHLLAFGGTRTFHRMVCAIEDAGFEIRDCIEWVYLTGYSKSKDVSKAFDVDLGLEEARGYLERPTGGLHNGSGASIDFSGGSGRQLADNPISAEAKRWHGFGSQLKPSHEPICVARKPLSGTIIENIRTYRTGALNIDGTRDGEGRQPTNVLIEDGVDIGDGGFFPRFHQSMTETSFAYVPKPSTEERESGVTHDGKSGPEVQTGPSNWNASKPAPANDHPSLKAIALLRWLCRLVTPPGGTVLDPFNGVGSTGCAARLEGFNYIGIELDPRYVRIAKERIMYWESRPPSAEDVPQIPAALKVAPSKQTSLETRW
jgi:DNA modification methylase